MAPGAVLQAAPRTHALFVPSRSVRLTVSALALFVAALASPVAGAADVTDAVRAALQTNPDIGIVVENQRAVSAELDQARGGYWPTVDFNAGYGADVTNTRATRNREQGPGDSDTVILGAFTSNLTMTQPLFDGFETQKEVERQQARLISASRRVRESSETIALDAVEAYLEALRQRELTALAEENVEIHVQIAALVEAKAAGGAATVADIQQAQSRLASAEATLTEAQARLRDADATYTRIVGEGPTGLSRPVAPSWALPPSLQEAIDLSLENNPTVSVLRADLDASRAEYEGTKTPFYPTLDLEISANYDEAQDGTLGADYEGSAMLMLNYNLFRGFQDKYARKEFLARIGEARQRLNRAIRLTEEEMRLAWNAVDSARDRVAVLQVEVEANDTVRRTYRQQFDLGGRSLLELLDSETELFVSRGALISAEFEESFSVYRILASAGVLLATLDVPTLPESQFALDPITPAEVDQELRALDVRRREQVGPPVAALTDAEPAPFLAPPDPRSGDGVGAAITDPAPSLDPTPLTPPGELLSPNAPLDPGAVLPPEALADPAPAPTVDPGEPAAPPSEGEAVLDPNALLDPIAAPASEPPAQETAPSSLSPGAADPGAVEAGALDPRALADPNALLDLAPNESPAQAADPAPPSTPLEEPAERRPAADLTPDSADRALESPMSATGSPPRQSDFPIAVDPISPEIKAGDPARDSLSPVIPDAPNGLPLQDRIFEQGAADDPDARLDSGDSGVRGDPNQFGDLVWGGNAVAASADSNPAPASSTLSTLPWAAGLATPESAGDAEAPSSASEVSETRADRPGTDESKPEAGDDALRIDIYPPYWEANAYPRYTSAE